MPSTRVATERAQPSTAARPAFVPSIPAPNWATRDDASIRDSVSSRTWPPNSAASCSMTVGPSAAATRSGSPRPQSIANGIPQTLPDGVVSGVLKSPCASNQAIAYRASGRAARRPAIAPAWAVQSPPRISRRVWAPSAPPSAAATRSRSRGRNAQIAARFLARGSGSGRKPGSIARSPRIAQLGAGQARAPPGACRPARAPASRPARTPSPTGDRPGRSGRRRSRSVHAMAVMVPHHGPVRIADFALERYFARWEFAVEHLLCASDVQGYPMAELLALADDETRALWDGLELGYTESTGHPLLRREIAALYETIEPDEVLTFAGAEEAIFCLANVAPRAGRPRDRHLARLPEPVRGRPCGRGGRDPPRAPRERRLGDRHRPAPRPGDAGDAAHRRQHAAQPDRDAARSGDLRRARRDRRRVGRAPAGRRGLSRPRVRRVRSPAGRRRRPRPRASRSA